MSVGQVHVTGTRRLKGLTPANTSEATMLTAGKERPSVVAVYIANLTGSAANATVKWGDGSTDFAVIDTYSVAARSFLHAEVFLPLREGWTIKVTSGTNNALAFTLVIAEYGSAVSGEHAV